MRLTRLARGAALAALDRRRRAVARRRHVLVACFPKSGSTVFARAVGRALGLRLHRLVRVYGRNEQDLDLARCLRMRGDTVTQQHVRATEPNLALIEGFRLRPVVLVRNLWDVLASLRDHVVGEAPEIPMAWIPEGFAARDPDAQIDFLLDLAVPWYLQFYVSWTAAERAGSVPLVWTSYEAVVADPVAEIGRVLSGLGAPRPEPAVRAAWDAAAAGRSRLNRGVAGRGAEWATPERVARMARLAAHYPDVDFAPIGISTR